MLVWSRGVKWDAANYHAKPYGSTQEIPVPEDLNYDKWMGPSEMVPYTADHCTNWGGYHCPETEGWITDANGFGAHERRISPPANLFKQKDSSS
ncbi:MAG: hypothetical protein K9N23_05100 [Akkermansiaceae bacterium]|nr:hypothetical protein [Akkermansiaceae bacterium]